MTQDKRAPTIMRARSILPHLKDRELKRFWSKVCVGHEGECWRWGAGTNRKGYGVFSFHGKTVQAHRTSWVIANRVEVPHGLVVRHSCDNPICVNPRHLEVGTFADNLEDAITRKRWKPAPPDGRANSKINWPLVDVIRTSSESNSQIADRLGVNQSTISRIRAGKAWRGSHV